ncbi:MAG: undecaprenyldiphospho-muramoylpentapeptide beta-N-acetylglucosaminyltransferase [Caldilineae bacterium]|nr:MAG: undecaprenyldiphospho-muramoylpentapeptide beta-N-acetylglucosaminyltransferase [Caldilineae bacterium]
MRLMISGGGTGGHVYPALAVVNALDPATEVVWVGSEGGIEKELVERAGIPFVGIAAGGLRGKNPAAAAANLWKLGRGYLQSRRHIARRRPDVLFVTGGYVCVPVTLAAHRAGVPVLIYLPDIQPGKAIQFLSRFAERVAVTAPPAQAHFPPGLTVVTGYPARAELYAADPAAARARLRLSDDAPVVLVYGGSQGARSINRALARPDALQQLLARAQVLHLSGARDIAWVEGVRRDLPESLRRRYHLHAYLHEEMVDAFAAADLVICRAGASTLGELPAAAAPAILVPYPYSGAHQWPNAQFLAEQGAAVILPDAELAERLLPVTLELLDDAERRSAMAAAARKLARPDAAHAIATLIEELRYGHH